MTALRNAVLFAIAGGALAMPQGGATHRSTDPSWHRYVRSPASSNVKPARIVADQTKGNVANADGLITGKAPTVLNRPSKNEPAPSIVVDFGQNVVGLLGISFAGSKNGTDALPGLKLAFSESMQFLGDSSDFTRSFNAGGVSCRGSQNRFF